jgi:hypothetical protein
VAERASAICNGRPENSFGRLKLSVSPILTVLVCLAVTGCAGLDVKESASPARAAAVPPDEKALAELVNTAFKTTKLTGAPEVSPVRATHDAQLGDWAFCIKSSDPEQSPSYAVLIKDNKILEIRSFVILDGCDKETYRPVEISSALKRSGVDASQPSRQRQTRAR